ncbi:MAG TPA: helix-hairpin-helix domain-containing protein [Pirellulaceae bacterium]
MTSPASDVWEWIWTDSDQRVIASAMAALLIGIVVVRAWQDPRPEGWVRWDEVSRQDADFKTDLNHAAWPELALIPGLGETLARRIVAVREHQGGFASVEDLLSVDGIGPKKLDAARPFLKIHQRDSSSRPSPRAPGTRPRS